jgi:uncharacterized membrane protein
MMYAHQKRKYSRKMRMTAVQQVIPLDEIDRSILMELQRDGRVAIADLAPRVGLSSSACLRRVRRLEDMRSSIAT